MFKINKVWFSLVELMVVVTIISIISASWSMYFYSFLNNKEIQDKIYSLNRDIDELDYSIWLYKILDYEIIINTTNFLWYYYYTNNYDSIKKQVLTSIDFSSWIWVITTNDIFPWLPMSFRIYGNDKMIEKNTLNSIDSYTWTFNKFIYNKVSSTIWTGILNDININYFWEENLLKNDDNFLKLVSINTKEDKTWVSLSNLVIKNTWKWKEVFWDWTKYNEVYLFFSKQWNKWILKIFTK
jgi:prepilin-type N-terminal cleavage/methylation domain-containing protein